MKNPIYAASHERAVRVEGGRLSHRLSKRTPPPFGPDQSFRAEQLPGYVEGRVYELGRLETGYVIPLRLISDRSSGTIITDWGLELPWPDHVIDWD